MTSTSCCQVWTSIAPRLCACTRAYTHAKACPPSPSPAGHPAHGHRRDPDRGAPQALRQGQAAAHCAGADAGRAEQRAASRESGPRPVSEPFCGHQHARVSHEQRCKDVRRRTDRCDHSPAALPSSPRQPLVYPLLAASARSAHQHVSLPASVLIRARRPPACLALQPSLLFGGFKDDLTRSQFEVWIDTILAPWCCRCGRRACACMSPHVHPHLRTRGCMVCSYVRGRDAQPKSAPCGRWP